MCCGVVPILFGWFLSVPSLYALVFIRNFFIFYILTSCERGLFNAIYTFVIGALKFTSNPAPCDKKCRSKHQVLFARAGESGTRLAKNSNNDIHDPTQCIHSGCESH